MAALDEFAGKANPKLQTKDIVSETRRRVGRLAVIEINVSRSGSIVRMSIIQDCDVASARLAGP